MALLDADPEKVGRTSRQGIPVLDASTLPELVANNRIDIGIVAVPAENAQSVCDVLAKAGINAILNFAPVQIRVPAGVKLKSVDLRINLESLSFHLKNAGL